MINLLKGLTFEAYLEKSKLEHGDIQLIAYNSTNLSSSTKDSLKKLTSVINVAIFSEGYCPDCIVTLPFIKRMAEENKNINLFCFPKSGYENFLEEYTGQSRIPTIITFDSEMNPKGAYIEFPKKLLEMMTSLKIEEKKDLVNDYRQGKYNHLIEDELLNIIL
ncbi:thioredoxin family protein [Clostridium bowmanii]|uniref:thioredoxin family protein n=1 Tax=Clostridium bowmanii TaxID=132925 RepID=UPI001C0C6FE6|nr:thioredoxin family protein [Clostridium bowmanii]MBU3188656.1 thioredoxin family protein [Clostridium bowmanii]MCA1073241.1 thioredoxin family protein [Clostridium bowmanii]